MISTSFPSSASFSSSSNNGILTNEQIQAIIHQCRVSDKKILQQYPTPFVSNYSPYSQNQLRDLHFNRDCALQWNTFYKNNGRKAYRDRHYILREFDEMKRELESKMVVETGKIEKNGDDDSSSSSSTGIAVVRRERRQDEGKGSSNFYVLLLDFGCGVGNLCLPMLDEYRDVLAVVASDLSQVAMQSLQNELNQRGLKDQVYCEQSDLGSNHEEKFVPNLVLRGIKHIRENSSPTFSANVFSSLVFVLCSVPQNLWNNVVLNIVNSLKMAMKEMVNSSSTSSSNSEQKGYLFFRDYCRDDLAMHRFQSHRAVLADDNINNSTNGNVAVVSEDDDGNNNNHNVNINNNKASTYMRTNGTLSHFFSLKEVEELFSPYFEILDLKIVTLAAPIRDVVSVDWQMNERKFIQGKFLLKKNI